MEAGKKRQNWGQLLVLGVEIGERVSAAEGTVGQQVSRAGER